METFKQIILLPYNYCNRTTGEVVSRINDLSTVREMISKVAYTLFIDLPLTLFSLSFNVSQFQIVCCCPYNVNFICYKYFNLQATF